MERGTDKALARLLPAAHLVQVDEKVCTAAAGRLAAQPAPARRLDDTRHPAHGLQALQRHLLCRDSITGGINCCLEHFDDAQQAPSLHEGHEAFRGSSSMCQQ